MLNPPRDLGCAFAGRLEIAAVPNLVNLRLSAQALHSAALLELHQGNLASALENLEALQAGVRVYADEPALVIYMIRVAVMGLATNPCWEDRKSVV